MFSLIVTIISIALVAAVAVATIYYGGPAFNQGKAGADAAKVMTQSQQILGAATLFSSDNGRWPLNVEELVATRYLGAAPVAFRTEPSTSQVVLTAGLDMLISSAHADEVAPASNVSFGHTWKTVSDNSPQYVLGASVSEAACRKINEKANNGDGIREAADVEKTVQCFGTAAPYTVLSQVPNKGTTLTTATLQTVTETATAKVLPNGGNWTVEPTTAAPAQPQAPEVATTLWQDVVALRTVAQDMLAATPNGFFGSATGAFPGAVLLTPPTSSKLPTAVVTSGHIGSNGAYYNLAYMNVSSLTVSQCQEAAAEGGIPVGPSQVFDTQCVVSPIRVGIFAPIMVERWATSGFVITTREDAMALVAQGADTSLSEYSFSTPVTAPACTGKGCTPGPALPADAVYMKYVPGPTENWLFVTIRNVVLPQ